jgi:hypothetical protein
MARRGKFLVNYLPSRNGILRGFFANFLDDAIFSLTKRLVVYREGTGLDDIGEFVQQEIPFRLELSVI